jgi:hypothetical protein
MSNTPSDEQGPASEGAESEQRRLFLQGMGKWSGAAIVAAVAGTWLGTEQQANAGWLNRRGGGGGWVNRGGGGGWINRRVGGGGGWINRW